jgi:hypothetical protein
MYVVRAFWSILLVCESGFVPVMLIWSFVVEFEKGSMGCPVLFALLKMAPAICCVSGSTQILGLFFIFVQNVIEILIRMALDL